MSHIHVVLQTRTSTPEFFLELHPLGCRCNKIFINSAEVLSTFCDSLLFVNRHKPIMSRLEQLHQQGLSRHDDVAKSASDLRNYRGLKLQNGMKIMLVSDSNTDKAAASMDVNVGSMCDPDDLPGLAHFCEHMLFLGTEKYPDENEYSKFINEHAGSSNAYTSGEHTNYYFDIGHDHLKEILDRFSQFFKSPLFDESCTTRELNAVHSEHEKNIMSDGWRLHQLDKSTADPNHKFSRFSTGNRETLDIIPKSNGICVREALLKYHDKFYSSNVMGLAVLGKESLDELEAMVTDMFDGIENKNVSPLTFDSSPYRQEELQIQMDVVPIKDVRNLVLSFPIKDYTDHYDSYPGTYVGHLIGHEGPGSILSELKRQGWVNALSAGDQGGAKGYDFFKIHVDLTTEGLTHVNDIVTCMYQYIDMLRKVGPQEWIFKEIQELNSLNFRFKDKERPTSCVLKLSSAMHDYPLQDALTAGVLLKEYRPDLIQELLDSLSPNNMRLTVIAKSFGDKATETEKWYGTKYNMAQLPSSQIDKWSNVQPNPIFHLPAPNEFIPNNFEIAKLPRNSSNIPAFTKSNKMTNLWFKQDDQFKLPKACLLFELFSPVAYISAQHANMVYLFVELFKDALNEYAYSAELAGLKYNLKNSVYGVQVEVRGYHDKQIVLLDKIFTKMATFQVDPKRFAIIKELYLRALKNFEAEQPYMQATYYTHALKTEKAWLKSDLVKVLPELTCEMLQSFIEEFLSYLHVESLIHGNLTRQDAIKLSDMVDKILQTKSKTIAYLESQVERFREVCIPAGTSYVHQHCHKVRDINAVDLYLQVGRQSTNHNVLLELLEQVMSEPCFNVLRTKEHLGYIVATSVVRNNGVHGLRVIVQSERTPDYLEGRVEAFVHHVDKILEEMTDADFARHVAALRARILEKPKKLSTEALKYWVEIISQQLMFRRDSIEADHLLTLKKSDLVNFYKEYIHIDAPHRSKLIVHILAKDLHQCPTTPEQKIDQTSDLLPCPTLPQSTVIDDFTKFKNGLELYPRVTPFIDVVEAKLAASL
ncbi:unnamed protein product [Clavelina lepadiformis]|uniref:Insulin-degrading enzyme n=1 Tax=Clavelina lepadiformis TaxID=159417 RepID=A0ABP0FBZ5_CLALP